MKPKQRTYFFTPNAPRDFGGPPRTVKEIHEDTADLLDTNKRSFSIILGAMADWASDKSGDLAINRGPLDQIRFWWGLASYVKELSTQAMSMRHPMELFWSIGIDGVGYGDENRYPYMVPYMDQSDVYNWTRIMLDSSRHAYLNILEVIRKMTRVIGKDLDHTDIANWDRTIPENWIADAEQWKNLSQKIDMLFLPPRDTRTGLHVGPIMPRGAKEWRPE